MTDLKPVAEVITEQLQQALQKDGAKARALGRSQFDNPFLKTENMPSATGDTGDEWNAKRDAWQMGWVIEDAMRG